MAVNDDGNHRSLADAVQPMKTRWPELSEATSHETPVFISVAGWRSGSTLLQRMLMPEGTIWGEPYG